MAGDTLILSRADVAALLTQDECIAAVENAFRLEAEGRTMRARVLDVPARDGIVHVKAAGVSDGRSYVAAKVNANFPDNPRRFGLPSIQGVLVLLDATGGFPVAVMDAIEITLQRTAAATAVAARRLARHDSRAVGICGCGVQGRAQLTALLRVLPLERVFAFDAAAEKARAFAAEMSALLNLEIEPVGSPREAAARSDVCVTCTPSRSPLLERADVKPGTFVAGVGSDHADKQELAASLLAGARVVVDDLAQCAVMGDLHHALAAGAMSIADVHATLPELVSGAKRGRQADDEIFVFDSTGTALEDVAAAALVYEKALLAGRGEAFHFFWTAEPPRAACGTH